MDAYSYKHKCVRKTKFVNMRRCGDFVGGVDSCSFEQILSCTHSTSRDRRLLDHDLPPPLLLDHDPSPPRLLDHELSPMIFQVMTQVRSALDVWAPLSIPKQLARENFSLNNREKNLIL
ncbi:hypothetical protein WN943_025087 [Citrus x changshan-huyou]